MKYDYYIALLTRGRTDKQATLKMLQPEMRSLVNVYCHPGERSKLMKEWGGQSKQYSRIFRRVYACRRSKRVYPS